MSVSRGVHRGRKGGRVRQTCAWLTLIVFAVRVLSEGVCVCGCVCQCGRGWC